MKLKCAIFLLIITSCAPTIKNFGDYQKQFTSKADFMPNKESLEGKSPKVVVFALEENGNQIASQAHLGTSIANNIENVLAQNLLAQLVDRNAVSKLQKEIALAELNKTGSYKGPQVSEYAISGTISNSSFTNKYSSGITYWAPKQGLVSIPPKHTYSSEVAGNLKIYELPSLSVIEVIEFRGKKVRTENVQQKGGFSLGGLQVGGEQSKGIDRDDGLVRRAGEDAVDNIKIEIKNAFAKKGYILEKRIYDKKSIFKITLGSLDGIRQGDEFEVISQYEVENPITNEIDIERRIIANGKITDKIDPKTSWVIIDDNKKANEIRIGDSIKMKYKKRSFEGIIKLFKSIFE